MGTSETLGRGAVQFMTAGSGVTHSEHNLDPKSPLRFIQVRLAGPRRSAWQERLNGAWMEPGWSQEIDIHSSYSAAPQSASTQSASPCARALCRLTALVVRRCVRRPPSADVVHSAQVRPQAQLRLLYRRPRRAAGQAGRPPAIKPSCAFSLHSFPNPAEAGAPTQPFPFSPTGGSTWPATRTQPRGKRPRSR